MTRKRKIQLAVIATLVLIVLAFVITGGIILSHGQGDSGEISYLLVLGMAVDGTEPSPILRDRIDEAYRYLTAHPDVICIVSGYQSGKGLISEAECMKRELMAMGIAENRIWMEPNASSTVENLQFALALIEENTGTRPETIGILSSEFHLLRAGMFAQEQGIDCVRIPAKTTDGWSFTRYFLREIVMVWYYSIF